MATEEFKIKTEVELDTKEAEAKLKSFVNGQNKPLEVDLKLKNLNSALNKDLKSLNAKINNQLEIKPESLKGFEQLDNTLKNIQTRLKGMKNLLNNGQINVFNMNGADPKLFDDNLKSIENYVKKVEKGYQKIKEAKEKVEKKPKDNIIDLDKAENDAKKFANRIDALKLQFNNLKLKIVGIDNLNNINNQLDELKNKARESALSGLGTNTPEIDRENKVLQEKYKLLKKIQSEYESFEKFKLDFGDSIDKDSLKEVETLFKNIVQKITTMDDLELDFNLDSFRTLINNIKTSLKNDLKLEIDLSKSEESYLKFFNNLEVLKFELQKLKGLDIDIIGEDNFKKIENRIDQLRSKAGSNLLQGKNLKDSDVDLGYKNLKEQEKLLKRVQAEYSKFQNKKNILETLIGTESVSKIESEFKEAFSKIVSMENLELDFDINKLFRRLKDIDNAYKIQIETDKAENKINKFQNKLEELKYKFNNLDIDLIGEDNFNKIKNQIKSIENETKNILYGTSDKKISDFDLDIKNLKEQERLINKILNAYTKFNEKRDILSNIVDKESLNEVDREFNEIISKITSMKNLKADFNMNNFFDAIKKVDKDFELEVDSSKAIDSLDKFENKLDLLKHNFNKLDLNLIGKDTIAKIENDINSIFNKAKSNFENGFKIESPEIQADLNNLKEQLRLLQKVQNLYNKFNQTKGNLSPDIDTSELKEIENIFERIVKKISSMKDLKLDFDIDGFAHSIENANNSIRKMDTNITGIKKVFSDFKNEIASYTIGEMLGDMVTDFARSLGQSYMELDRSMREIKKVADISDIDTKSELNEIRKQAIGIAKDVGMASHEVQSSIGSALQAGMGGMRESIEVAKQSMILANVGDMTQDSASKAINTVVKSFQLSPLKSYQVEVGNTVRKTTELKNAMDMMNYAG